MPTESEFEAVLTAIEENEGSGGQHHCSNETIVEATGLDAKVVADVLGILWRDARIEGAVTMGGVKPHLMGIVRVLPGRQRVWGGDGYFQPQP
jgi:hypothetical protein